MTDCGSTVDCDTAKFVESRCLVCVKRLFSNDPRDAYLQHHFRKVGLRTEQRSLECAEFTQNFLQYHIKPTKFPTGFLVSVTITVEEIRCYPKDTTTLWN